MIWEGYTSPEQRGDIGLCKSKIYVPQPEHVPKALRELSEQVIEALRPLDIDAGKFERAQYGYRVHSSMMTFAWSAKSVPDKIKALEKRRDRKRAKAAQRFLMKDEDSLYSTFAERHETFLKHRPDADEKKRKRPLRFIEECGLECALWPHLYWHANMCETVVRLTDTRRNSARRTGLSESSSDGEDSERDGPRDEPELTKGRHSIRRSFMIKVLSPVVGYSEDYTLLHFTYDLVMWSNLGGCKNATRGMPLRLAMKGASFTPAYWKVRHMGLVDMQRQCGFPTLFRTRAPYEKAFPYHCWVMDEMSKCGRGRQQLALPETLHMAHVLKEFDRGYFTGLNTQNTSRPDRKWTDHLLGGGQDYVEDTVMNGFGRLEFQDGKRKRGSQKYHGRGTTHSHSVDYLRDVKRVKLEDKMSASIPPLTDPLLRGLVLDGQLDYKKSGWPVREEESKWDEEEQRVLLHHSTEDNDKHVRAYFPEAMKITKCHEDVLHGDGRGALLRYVSTYVPKFSDAFAKEWLNDKASDYSVARRVLFDYKPLEPEMILSLAGRQFPQCYYGGTLLPLLPPWPGMAQKPGYVEKYQACQWRREATCMKTG